MGDILIRNVDEELVGRLKFKAELNGTSLQHEASEALRKGAPMSPEERRALFDKWEREGMPQGRTSGADMVRAVRDEEDDD